MDMGVNQTGEDNATAEVDGPWRQLPPIDRLDRLDPVAGRSDDGWLDRAAATAVEDPNVPERQACLAHPSIVGPRFPLGSPKVRPRGDHSRPFVLPPDT